MAESARSRSEEWQANERELERVCDLPVGPADPAAREAELHRQQDEIEHEIGEAYLRQRRSELLDE